MNDISTKLYANDYSDLTKKTQGPKVADEPETPVALKGKTVVEKIEGPEEIQTTDFRLFKFLFGMLGHIFFGPIGGIIGGLIGGALDHQ